MRGVASMGVTSPGDYLFHSLRVQTTPGDESFGNLQRLMKVTHQVIRKPQVTMTWEGQVVDDKGERGEEGGRKAGEGAER